MNQTVKHKIKYTITDGEGVLHPWVLNEMINWIDGEDGFLIKG